MSKPRPTPVDDLSLDELRGLVVELLARVSALEEENAALKDEVARLKGLKGRPKGVGAWIRSRSNSATIMEYSSSNSSSFS